MSYEQEYSELIADEANRGEPIGAGLSGTVHRVEWNGRVFAEKCFSGGGLAAVVHILFSGAPNPYRYDHDAVTCAYYRRKILARLFKFWFGDRLSVAEAEFIRQDTENQCLTLGCRFVEGRAPGIAAPFNRRDHGEVKELISLMSDLQKKLKMAGFAGALWQAGYGNPVALNNFLKTEEGWSMIDLESGVPALFPSNPLKLFFYYIPQAIKRFRPLFDDVNIRVLRRWVEENREELGKDIEMAPLSAEIDALEEHQTRLYKKSRRTRTIEHAFFRGRIDESKRDKLSASWFRWFFWILCTSTIHFFCKIGRGIKKGFAKIGRFFAPRRFLANLGRLFLFFVSIRYRHKVGLKLTRKRIFKWAKRKQLTPREVRNLNRVLKKSKSEDYMTDFIFLLGIKPLVKSIQVVVAIVFFGSVTHELAVSGFWEVIKADHGILLTIQLIFFIMIGGLVRFLYTVAVSIYRRDLPLIALIFSIVPTLGNVAFPLQMLVNGGRRQLVATFLIYDTFSLTGIHFPIWGGQDTRTEHAAVAFCRFVTFTRPRKIQQRDTQQ